MEESLATPGGEVVLEDVAAMLHDDVLQSVIAARWALEDVAGDLSDGAAAALTHVASLLDHSQAVVRRRIADLRAGFDSHLRAGAGDGSRIRG